MLIIRREGPEDVEHIDAVHTAAFPSPGDGAPPIEAELVRLLRADPGWVPALSLVAEDERGDVLGHVVGTEGSLSSGARVVGLGPLGVLPASQRRGIATNLVHAVVAATDALGYDAAVLLGDPAFYARFGFVPAATIGIAAPDPEWGAHFQARALSTWSSAVAGDFRYAAPFDAF